MIRSFWLDIYTFRYFVNSNNDGLTSNLIDNQRIPIGRSGKVRGSELLLLTVNNIFLVGTVEITNVR
jgi:hypothetical protein